ncbi:hypothetical protein F4604DRAFT_1910703 [Suillus subluteus]|nr:hypothetical protein F4604DRAFT_1910703 [Suillus subluteus]
MSESARKRKPRDTPPPYGHRQQKKLKVKNTPVTSAQPAAVYTARQNLTLSDWLTVFEEDVEPEVSRAETLALCQRLERACLQFGNVNPTLPLELLKQIRLFHAELRREELLHSTQTTIDAYFH